MPFFKKLAISEICDANKYKTKEKYSPTGIHSGKLEIKYEIVLYIRVIHTLAYIIICLLLNCATWSYPSLQSTMKIPRGDPV